MAGHVLALTGLANLGKMVPALCYRREAHWKARLALAIGMWPRGEVGVGVLIVSLGYGLGGPMITAAMLSLALNLVLTGAFILLVQWLVAGEGTLTSADLVPGVHPLQNNTGSWPNGMKLSRNVRCINVLWVSRHELRSLVRAIHSGMTAWDLAWSRVRRARMHATCATLTLDMIRGYD
jgi:Kef-type K+ transport system membrane component KefB